MPMDGILENFQNIYTFTLLVFNKGKFYEIPWLVTFFCFCSHKRTNFLKFIFFIFKENSKKNSDAVSKIYPESVTQNSYYVYLCIKAKVKEMTVNIVGSINEAF